ncbi:molybdenum cofactor guanylyltransferase MobA [Melaminivora jejuensis]|uniref:molybdenum cofactor guanylyltransferase MobA n=1 Tax=Melaminivora jejuensis TaxID=1267217 RepID=UPI001E48F376|nr:molybdenum cofactor guanylyltransferase MobA [Melaminivora jejuensis]UHJ66269.1 molybdenum cofactor guanylyltransferase [Melaminivora jejuensis]
MPPQSTRMIALQDIAAQDITALVLAGGRATRMGGVDKGLQPFRGTPLALHAARRVQPQVGSVLINANRHLDTYRSWGLPVVSDADESFAGPLAGFAAGLAHCRTPWLLALACDTPLFAHDLAQRLAAAACGAGAPIAIAAAPQHGQEAGNGAREAAQDGAGPPLHMHPALCLLHVSLLPDLQQFLAGGGRRVRQWGARHGCAIAVFDQPGDSPQAFANANTLEQLRALEEQAAG